MEETRRNESEAIMSHKEITIEEMQSLIKTFSDFTNGCSHDYDGKLSDAIVEAFFQEHRYLQGEMLGFIYKILGKIGERSNPEIAVMWTDARNEGWIKWAKNASKAEFI